jgi:hypothetical protein
VAHVLTRDARVAAAAAEAAAAAARAYVRYVGTVVGPEPSA